MNGATLAVFAETLRRHWRGMLFWGIGIGLLGAMQALVLQDVDSLQQIADLMETLPPFFVQAFAGGDAQYMATAEGYLASQFFSFALVVFAAYTIGVGLQVTANEEDRGQMDVLLSLPVTRTRLILEKTAAFALLTCGVVVLTLLCIAGGIAATPALPIDMGRIAVGTLNILPGSLLILTLTVFLGGLIGNRSRVLTIAAVVVIVSYVIDILAVAAPGTLFGTLRTFSLFRYYDGVFVIRDGLNLGNVVLLLVVSAALLGGGVLAFNRRDVGV
ncbi:MAG: ABC transporter permease subunit [Chloroflexota bacterium]|nr:ABC transporter permease subunit [Chloroflexota bacterium]